MGGMFPSGTAKFSFMNSINYTTDVAGGQMGLTSEVDLTKNLITLIRDGWSILNGVALDPAPAGITVMQTAGTLTLLCDDTLITDEGRWCCTLYPGGGSALTGHIPQMDYCDVGGLADLVTQVPAQNILPMLNNGQPVRQTDTPTFVFLPFVDPATGLPDTSTPTMMVLPPGGFGESLTVMGTGPWFNNSSPTFTTAGRYFVMLQATINGVLFSAYGYVDWGDPGCVAISTNTLADTAAAQATLARKVLANKTTPNSSVTPTSLTVYDDDGVTTLGTRTIANADASAVSPTQVLDLGPIV